MCIGLLLYVSSCKHRMHLFKMQVSNNYVPNTQVYKNDVSYHSDVPVLLVHVEISGNKGICFFL